MQEQHECELMTELSFLGALSLYPYLSCFTKDATGIVCVIKEI